MTHQVASRTPCRRSRLFFLLFFSLFPCTAGGCEARESEQSQSQLSELLAKPSYVAIYGSPKELLVVFELGYYTRSSRPVCTRHNIVLGRGTPKSLKLESFNNAKISLLPGIAIVAVGANQIGVMTRENRDDPEMYFSLDRSDKIERIDMGKKWFEEKEAEMLAGEWHLLKHEVSPFAVRDGSYGYGDESRTPLKCRWGQHTVAVIGNRVGDETLVELVSYNKSANKAVDRVEIIRFK